MTPPIDWPLYLTTFVLGVLVGMLTGGYLIGHIADKAVGRRRKQLQEEEHDPADWWKTGGNPPGVYEDD